MAGDDRPDPTDRDEAGRPADLNERVVDEWTAETTPVERVVAVARRTRDPASAEDIAERARTSTGEARTHLDRLAAIGHLDRITDADDGGPTRYRRDPVWAVGERARELLDEADADELAARIAELENELATYRAKHDAGAPEAAPDIGDSERADWTTTRRNLQIARVARRLEEAASVAVPSVEDRG
jgi:predicted ArsR family transcriptional regulator